MPIDLEEKITAIKNRFKDFKYFIELGSVKDFLLFTLNAPSKIVIGPSFNFGKRESVSVGYDPFRKIYFTQMHTNMLSGGSVTAYFPSESLTDELVLKKDNKFFDDFFTKNEKDVAFATLEKFLFLQKAVAEFEDRTGGKPVNIKINEYFKNLESFISSNNLPICFILEGKDKSEPDLLFTFNLSTSINIQDINSLNISCYLDSEQKTRGFCYIKQDENLKVTLMEDLKDISHSELFKSTFVLLINIKSFNIP